MSPAATDLDYSFRLGFAAPPPSGREPRYGVRWRGRIGMRADPLKGLGGCAAVGGIRPYGEDLKRAEDCSPYGREDNRRGAGMKLKDAIERVSGVKPHAIPEEALTEWINEVEGMVQLDVMLLDPLGLIRYDWEKDQDTELLVNPPHDKLYISYLEAKIDYKNGEYDKYQASQAMFEEHYLDFTIWYIEHIHPADGPCF